MLINHKELGHKSVGSRRYRQYYSLLIQNLMGIIPTTSTHGYLHVIVCVVEGINKKFC